MPVHPTPRCACGLLLQPYVSLSLNAGQGRQSYVARISDELAWTSDPAAAGDARRPLRGIWAASADDLLRFGDARAGAPPQHDIHFYGRPGAGSLQCRLAPGHALAEESARAPVQK